MAGKSSNRESQVRGSSGSKKETDERRATVQKAPGRRNNRLTAAKKVKRDRAIVADRLSGFTWTAVAARNGLEVRSCQKIVKAALSNRTLPWTEPFDALEEHLAQLDAVVGDLAELAETTDNPSVRLGAIRSRADVLTRRIAFLIDAGVLPSHLDMTRAKTEIFDFVEMVERRVVISVPQEYRADLIGHLRRLMFDFANERPSTLTGMSMRHLMDAIHADPATYRPSALVPSKARSQL